MNATPAPEPLEATELNLGFVPLSDCAPLVAAYEKGFFAQEGLNVTLHRERSWAGIRDKTAFGVFDAAQMLYPMPLASTLGVSGPTVPMISALCLSLGGNAITVSELLYQEMLTATGVDRLEPTQTADAVRQVVALRRDNGRPPLTFGCVFATSTHHYELRQWLASGGVDVDLDVRVIVETPPDMPEALREGRLDGFCVGEPWNTRTVQQGLGRVVMTKHTLWNHGPEKVLGVTRQWAEAHPHTHLALLRSLIAAGAWCDDPDNRDELVHLIAADRYLDLPLEVIRPSLGGRLTFAPGQEPEVIEDFMLFSKYAANFPWVSHGRWYLEQMVRAGQLDVPDDADTIAASVMRPDLYRAACDGLGVAYPLIDHKAEDVHAEPWTLTKATAPLPMGSDLMLSQPASTTDPDRAMPAP